MVKLLKLPEEFEKQYEAEFISKPTDIVWLDREELSHKMRFDRQHAKCMTCEKIIDIMFRSSMYEHLKERVRGKICPNCNHGSLRIEF